MDLFQARMSTETKHVIELYSPKVWTDQMMAAFQMNFMGKKLFVLRSACEKFVVDFSNCFMEHSQERDVLPLECIQPHFELQRCITFSSFLFC